MLSPLRLRPLPLLLVLGAGCGNTEKADGGSSSGDGGSGSGDFGDLEMPAQQTVNDGHFATAEVCAECHANADGAEAMRDAAGNPIGQYDLWQATMMANAGRDPFFWAVLSSEVAAAPHLAEHIVQTCTTCHAPMAVTDAGLHGEEALSAVALRAGESDRAQLGLDGVSCASCHQITDEGLGNWSSFSGGYTIEADGEMYGPHADPETHPMEMHAGFTPVEADHIVESGLCATCHTLETEALDASGARSGVTMVEQAPYLEWQNSAYGDAEGSGTSCQSCHVPTRDDDGEEISTAIVRNPSGQDFGWAEDRSPFGRHLFVGGNTWMLGLIRDNAATLNPGGSPEAFELTIAATRSQLEDRTARVSLADVVHSGDELALTVVISIFTGHKFPTAHPSRRAWLMLEVADASGAVLFRSGGWDTQGRLVDTAGAVLASEQRGGPVLGHFDTVSADAEVQVYQSVMQDLEGEPTFRLLAGAGYWKDNRLLPLGWDEDGAEIEHIAAVGVGGDTDFTAGGDRVHLKLEGLAASGPLTVRAALVYQTASARYLDELAAWDTPEVTAFMAMVAASDRTPETVASAEATVE